MTPCADTEHKPVWVDEAEVFECARCLTLIRAAPNHCMACGYPVDDHKLFLADVPVCPPPANR